MAVPNLRIHDEGALRWDPAEVDVPGVPAIAPSDDPMSVMVAAVMPEIPTEVAEKVAAKIASHSLPAVMMTKEAVNRAYETTLSEGILFERRVFHSMFATEDQKEGMAAFREKRKPDFKHR